MTDFFFDTPYWFLGLLLIAGAALLVSANNRQDKRFMLAGLGVIGVAVLLAALSFFVETDKEIVIRQTRQLIDAVGRKDSQTVDGLLHRLAFCHGLDKQDLVDATRTAVDVYHLKNLRVASIEAEHSRDAVTVVLTVGADLDSSGYAGAGPPSTWQLVWVKMPEGWRLKDISALKLPGVDIRSVVGRFRK